MQILNYFCYHTCKMRTSYTESSNATEGGLAKKKTGSHGCELLMECDMTSSLIKTETSSWNEDKDSSEYNYAAPPFEEVFIKCEMDSSPEGQNVEATAVEFCNVEMKADSSIQVDSNIEHSLPQTHSRKNYSSPSGVEVNYSDRLSKFAKPEEMSATNNQESIKPQKSSSSSFPSKINLSESLSSMDILTSTGDKVFSGKSSKCLNVKRHTLTGKGVKKFSCELCSYKVNHRTSLKTHILTHTGEKPFSCEMCTYKSSQRANLRTHILIHTGEKPFKCEFCSYRASNKGHLKEHILVHTGEKPFSCKLCSYKSRQRTSLKTHILTHTGEKPFSCELCSYKSNQMANLKAHFLTHTGEKPFKCEFCSYKASNKAHLKGHILKHTGEKPFSCDLCSYKSRQRTSLRAHMLSHTTEKPFSCKFCSFKSAERTNMEAHIFSHTGEKPVSCEFCSYISSNKTYLKKHVIRKHTGKSKDER